MYQEFSIVSLIPKLEEKTIIAKTNFDIDKNSINSSTIVLLCKYDSSETLLTFEVNKNELIINIEEDLIPNAEYILKISNIKSILGEKLISGIVRRYKYDSIIIDIPEIISPSNYEQIDNKIKIELKSNYTDNDFNYLIQISDDVAFINIVRESIVGSDGQLIEEPLKEGQYFIKARIEKEINNKKEVGKWSKVITFISSSTIIKDENNSNNKDDNDLSNEPEFIKEITLTGYPKNGETPNSIILEYSDKIDPNFKGEIFVIRRDL